MFKQRQQMFHTLGISQKDYFKKYIVPVIVFAIIFLRYPKRVEHLLPLFEHLYLERYAVQTLCLISPDNIPYLVIAQLVLFHHAVENLRT